MQRMLDETRRRRSKQLQYNVDHHITATTVFKTIDEVLAATAVADVKAARDARRERAKMPLVAESVVRYLTAEQKKDLIGELQTEMERAARDLEFERAAGLRDEIAKLEEMATRSQGTRTPLPDKNG
jgi:excinuclease ABC subunit B